MDGYYATKPFIYPTTTTATTAETVCIYVLCIITIVNCL